MTEMTRVTVLQSFDVSDDGIRIRKAVAGTQDAVLASLFPGLRDAGLVEALGVTVPASNISPDMKPIDPPTTDPVEIPADWRDMHHLKIIALAKRIDPAVTNKAEAVAVIEAALGAA